MFNDIVRKLTPELLNITREVLAENLPQMLKVYSELRRRTELCDGPLIVSIKELAQSLGWNIRALKSTLINLVNYCVIDYRTNNNDDEWIITFLVS